MKKSDLDTGMVVLTKSGARYIVMRHKDGTLTFMNAKGHGFYNDCYDEDLNLKSVQITLNKKIPIPVSMLEDYGYDIVKVFDYVKSINSASVTEKLLWDREESTKKKLTIDEIENLLGFKVEIVKDHK